jgi:hypothetical protein
MIDIVDQIKNLKNQLKNNNDEVILIKNLFPDVLDWKDFITLIDFTVSKNHVSSNIRKEKIAEYKEEYYLRFSDVIDPNTKKSTGELFPKLDSVVDFFNDIFEETVNYAESYVNLTSKASIKLPHNDQWTAVIWDCIGKIECRIYKDCNDENYDSYILFAGDAIIIPKGKFHSIVPLEPRFSMSLAYNSDKNII